MKRQELYATLTEPQFDQWLARHKPLDTPFADKHELYDILSRQHLEGEVDACAAIQGPVYVAVTAQIRAGAVLVGPTIIGPDAIIDYGTKIFRGTCMGAAVRSRAARSAQSLL